MGRLREVLIKQILIMANQDGCMFYLMSFDLSPVVPLGLSIVSRGVWWEGEKQEVPSFPSHHPLLPPRALREDDWVRVSYVLYAALWEER